MTGLLLLAGLTQAQPSLETRTFDAAVRAFDTGTFEFAERDFAAFVQGFPTSPLVPDAVLHQARAAIKQQKLQTAVELLTTHLPKAGLLADRYRYYLADAYLESTNYQAAAEMFARLIKEFPQSTRLLEASYGEALSRFRLKEWSRVTELLQSPNGTFQKEARARSSDEFVVRGYLLLGEALLENKQYPAAEQAIVQMPARDLIPEYAWRRQYLLCRIQLADQRRTEALASTTNLLKLAGTSGQRDLLAESVAMRGKIFEELKDLDAAIQTYTNNLAETVPADQRQQAFLRTIELTLSQGRLADASEKLDAFFNQYPQGAGADVALLTLSEVHLRQHLAHGLNGSTNAATNVLTGVTNHLDAALSQFNKFITTCTNSPLLGQAHLNRGWCLWIDGKISESRAAFQAAAATLPFSENLAVARFKLADAQFHQRDFTNALANYRAVVTEFASVPRVQTSLAMEALSQIVRASLEIGDLAGATNAMQRMLRDYPGQPAAEKSLLLVGQRYTAAGRAAEAREVFALVVARVPNSTLRPEVDLAIARTFVDERQWSQAIAKYQDWLRRFRSNELRPQAEFNLAWSHYQAGQETNAFNLFTNFLAQFPMHALAPRAQFWLGSYFYGQKDYVNAELSFQNVQRTNWPPTYITYEAQMMAGRSAVARQSYEAARGYFTNLINNLKCPSNLVAEAFFALGDTVWLQDADPNQPFQRIEEARVAFNYIPERFPDHPLVPRAWGRIGDCYLQLATEDGKLYDSALDAYQKVLQPNLKADIGARCQAEVGMGVALEQQAKLKKPSENAALLKAALDHYLNVVFGRILVEGEQLDPVWLKEAGLAAARLAEAQKQWDVALKIYGQLKSALPVLGPSLDKRIEKAREQAPPDQG